MTLEKFPSIIATATFFAIAGSAAHEWGYFGIIGVDFQSLYSTYDYLALLIVSVGPAFIILTIWVAAEFALRRASNFERETPAKSKIGRFLQNWFLEIGWLVILIISLLFGDETGRFSLYLLIALLLMRVCGYVISWQGFKGSIDFPTFVVLIAFPAALIVAYGVGRDSAYSDLKDTKDTKSLFQMKLKDQSIHTVKILRLIDKGGIVFDPTSKTVQFHKSDDIVSLSKQAPEWDTKSLVCRRWGWRCTPSTAPEGN